MNKICTSLEQSKKLIKLGIDINTADMYRWYSGRRYYVESMDDDDFNEESDVLAWSLTALIKLMPFHIIENNRFGFYQVKGFNKQGETYRFGYKTNNDSFLFETSWHNDIVDAAFEIVCWLKENEKI
jgi:hypothetical protein